MNGEGNIGVVFIGASVIYLLIHVSRDKWGFKIAKSNTKINEFFTSVSGR
jgi:hypothetical protein